MRNVHERTIDASAEEVGALLDRLGQAGDPLWPAPAWQPMRLDRPLQVGADGGHGPIRYWVSGYEPGRRVRFTVHPKCGIDGHHEFTVEPLGEHRCVVRHVLAGQPSGLMRALMPLAVRWLHDAVLEDLLDNAERAATGQVARSARWSPWVRLLRRYIGFPKPRAVPIPGGARLARGAFDRLDLADAWQVPLLPGAPADPHVWADAVFRDPPRWVAALLWVRNRLVRLVGIAPEDGSAFDTVEQRGGELLLGTDARHLDFRASILVEAEAVTLTTVAAAHNRRGRLYMAVVRRTHPAVVRSMLSRARRRLAEKSRHIGGATSPGAPPRLES